MAAFELKRIPLFSAKDKERFLRQVRTGSDTECWPWIGYIDKNGYGDFMSKRIHYKSHRVAYYLATGDDPYPLLTCHTCDSPSCCNPAHLYKGTSADNAQDRATRHPDSFARGDASGPRRHPERIRRGINHPFAVMTNKSVAKLRKLYATRKYAMHELGDRFGINTVTVWSILHGKTWKHIGNQHPKPFFMDRQGVKNGRAKLTDKDVRNIRRRAALGDHDIKALAQEYDVTTTSIRFIIKRKTWKHVV